MEFSIDDFRHNTFAIQINHVVIIGISRIIWLPSLSLTGQGSKNMRARSATARHFHNSQSFFQVDTAFDA